MRGLIALIAVFASTFTFTAMAQSNGNNDEPQKPVQKRIESVEVTDQPKSSGWTQERMQRAKPLPLPRVDPDKKNSK